jgi:hypothetical protein
LTDSLIELLLWLSRRRAFDLGNNGAPYTRFVSDDIRVPFEVREPAGSASPLAIAHANV